MTTPTIAPCPFCGSHSTRLEESDWGDGYYVRCDPCWAAGPASTDAPEAIDTWNTVARIVHSAQAREATNG